MPTAEEIATVIMKYLLEFPNCEEDDCAVWIGEANLLLEPLELGKRIVEAFEGGN
jgi:hypothetical protein